MKKLYFLLAISIFTISLQAQWQQIWSSSNIDYNSLSGWIDFDKSGDGWSKRMYTLDTIKFQVMQSGYSSQPEYTYTFSDAEKLAGYQIYSLNADLNNDNHPEFYVLAYYGPSSNYRQAFKILDITTGTVLFEKNEQNGYYSYPVMWDMNNDQLLECLVTRFEYPLYANYRFEIYSTGLVGANGPQTPVKFEMLQNFPNPFNPTTNINFSLDKSENISIRIYDIKGELVKTLVTGTMQAGSHSVQWDGTNDGGSRQATGVYFYELRSEANSIVKKMLLLK